MPAWDVAVIGAGPAGLLAGIAAGRAGARAVVLEKRERPGRKLALTGGGRCNFGNTLEPGEFVERFGDRNARRLGRALALFPGGMLRALLARRGVEARLERGIRLYTASGKAEDVVDALAAELAESGAALQPSRPVARIERLDQGFLLRTQDRGDLAATALVLATGGLSYPETGSTGDGFGWALELGHQATPLRPGLIGLECLEPWPGSLAGLVLPDVAATLLPPAGGRPLARERAELLFTHTGISGPAVLDLSLVLSRSGLETGRLDLDFLPGRDLEQTEALVWEACRRHPRRAPARALAGLLPARLLERLAARWRLPSSALDRAGRRMLARRLKAAALPVALPRQIQRAEVTVGGLRWEDIEPSSLGSRRVPGLFFAGELLDVAGRCGGFNLQAAFSTGFLAGRSAAGHAGFRVDGSRGSCA